MRKRNKDNFWKIYSVCTIFAVILLVCGFMVFHSYIGAYEASQPHTAVEGYLASLKDEDISSMVASAVDKLQLGYENRDDYITQLTGSVDAEKLTYRKNMTEYSAASPVFSLVSNNREIIRLKLKSGKSGSFGFGTWELDNAWIPIDGVVANAKEYKVYVPHGSTLTVNGITPTLSSTEIDYPISSALEATTLSKCDLYELGTMYNAPELECLFGGNPCVFYERGEELFYFTDISAPQNYKINAPTGAEVYVNGILLDSAYLTESSQKYPTVSVESALQDVPTYDVYSTGELFTSPTVTAKLDGAELTAQVTDGACTFEYPADRTYSITVKVPAGSKVTCDGVDISEFAEYSSESEWDDLFGDKYELPKSDVYRVKGLFSSEHTIAVTLNGTELKAKKSEYGNSVVYSANESAVLDSSISEFAMDFAKAYFHYTSEGYRNTSANLSAVLDYVVQGSELYRKIKDSKVGYDYVTPVTRSDYKVFEISGMARLDDGTYAVKIEFDIDQLIVYVNQNKKGSLSMHITGDGAGLKISDMVIVSE